MPLAKTVNTALANTATVTELTPDQREVFKLLYAQYKDDYARVSLQLESIEKIQEYILNHISMDNISIIKDKETVYQILFALKQHLVPTDQAKEFQISQKYALMKRFDNAQPVETWLDTWERTFKEAVQIKLPEIKNNRPLYDFATAIASMDENYACAMEFDINRAIKLGTLVPTINDLIEDYRNHWRRKDASTLASNASLAGSAEFKGEPRKKRKCQCQKEHLPSECFYWNASIRPANWAGKKEIFDKMDTDL